MERRLRKCALLVLIAVTVAWLLIYLTGRSPRVHTLVTHPTRNRNGSEQHSPSSPNVHFSAEGEFYPVTGRTQQITRPPVSLRPSLGSLLLDDAQERPQSYQEDRNLTQQLPPSSPPSSSTPPPSLSSSSTSSTLTSTSSSLRSRPKSPACARTRPDAIKTWRGNGLVTSVYPPVEANCQQLQAGTDRIELRRVIVALNRWTNSISDQMFYENITKCSYVRELFSSDNFYISETEKKFPLAYAMLFYDSPQQIVRLLKVIYRPQNIYCLHPDGKANPQLIRVFSQLASCLDNVFVPRELVKVTYMHFSMVEAQMWCFQQLATTYRHWQWKYAMILCGKELPFSSNRVIVDNLRKLHGASVIDIRDLPAEHYFDRFQQHHIHNPVDGRLYTVGVRNDRPPYGIKIYKSHNYIAASRQFVKFLLKNRRVQAIRQYMSTAKMPDEEFFATTYMLPEAPKGDGRGVRAGMGKDAGGMYMVKIFFLEDIYPVKCTGKVVHFSCILNIFDLPMLFDLGSRGTTYFFYNKYLINYDHVVMDCMERRIVEQNKLEYKRDCLD